MHGQPAFSPGPFPVILNKAVTPFSVNYIEEESFMKKAIVILGLLVAAAVPAQTYQGETRAQTPEEKLNEMYCTGMFQSAHGTILDVASSTSAKTFLNILDWMQGRVAGLQVYRTHTGVSVPVMRGNVPGVYLDEIPVSLDYLSALSVNDIAIVKVIRGPFYGGFNGGKGAIAIYTFGGEEEEEE
jgi:hypothetical protein